MTKNADTWSLIREEYAKGGVTQRALAEKYDVPLGSLRRKAAAEKWSQLKCGRQSGSTDADSSAIHTRMNRQLTVTDRLLEIISAALEKEDELYYHVEFAKASSGSEFIYERLPLINDERLARLIKAAADVFSLQRMVLGIHEYKDELSAAKLAQDERLTIQKLEAQSELAVKKLELELLKLDTAENGSTDADGFLEALGLTDAAQDVEVYSDAL